MGVEFINYLKDEEMKEKDRFSLDMPECEMFTYKAEKSYLAEKSRIIKSAKKNTGNKRATKI